MEIQAFTEGVPGITEGAPIVMGRESQRLGAEIPRLGREFHGVFLRGGGVPDTREGV